jgi:hypothetical protein
MNRFGSLVTNIHDEFVWCDTNRHKPQQFCPVSRCDRYNAFGSCCEIVPSFAEGRDNGVVIFV